MLKFTFKFDLKLFLQVRVYFNESAIHKIKLILMNLNFDRKAKKSD